MKKKISYIWDYYKLHIFIGLFVLYMIGSLGYHFLHQTPADLYVGFVNVAPGDEVRQKLLEDYSSKEIYTYENLLITDNADDDTYSYVQASELKVLAAIEDKKFDVVIMDRETYDTFLENEYLCNLHNVITDENAFSSLEKKLFSDYAIDLKNYALIKNAGFSSDIYLGVIANSPRAEEVNNYLTYLDDCLGD